MRTKAGGLTQLNYGHVYVMPAVLEKVTRDSRFGLNGIAYPELARREGNGWVRFENLKWSMVSMEPGVYRFDGSLSPYQRYDEIFRSYRDNGLFTMPYLFLTPKYLVPKGAKGDGVTYPPTDMSKYGEFVFQAVARYGSRKHTPAELLTNDKISGLGLIDTYELWNEADLNDPNWGSWRGVFTDYYVMYRFGAEAVKKADPNAKVANGGWSGMDVPLMETMRSYKYADGKCPLDFTDVLSVHYYSFRVAPELATLNSNMYRDGVPLQQQTFEHELDALVAWRDRVKPEMPIWMSETGYDSGGPHGVDERLQACWLPRDLMMILASGIDKVQVFRETGSGGSLFSASGVIRDDGSLKPSWFTYATLIRQLDGVTQRATKVPFDDGNVRVYLWKRGDKTILTAWAIQDTAVLDVPLGRATITDAFGNSRRLDGGGPLKLTEFPVYITDIADPAVVKLFAEQARKAAEKERQRIERQSKLQARLFKFGRSDAVPAMTLGTERKYTMVLAANPYDEARGYGFQTKGLTDAPARWHGSPLANDAVKMNPHARFTFQAAPGEYVLSVCVRAPAGSQIAVSGIEGGDRLLKRLKRRHDESPRKGRRQTGHAGVQFLRRIGLGLPDPAGQSTMIFAPHSFAVKGMAVEQAAGFLKAISTRVRIGNVSRNQNSCQLAVMCTEVPNAVALRVFCCSFLACLFLADSAGADVTGKSRGKPAVAPLGDDIGRRGFPLGLGEGPGGTPHAAGREALLAGSLAAFFLVEGRRGAPPVHQGQSRRHFRGRRSQRRGTQERTVQGRSTWRGGPGAGGPWCWRGEGTRAFAVGGGRGRDHLQASGGAVGRQAAGFGGAVLRHGALERGGAMHGSHAGAPFLAALAGRRLLYPQRQGLADPEFLPLLGFWPCEHSSGEFWPRDGDPLRGRLSTAAVQRGDGQR